METDFVNKFLSSKIHKDLYNICIFDSAKNQRFARNNINTIGTEK